MISFYTHVTFVEVYFEEIRSEIAIEQDVESQKLEARVRFVVRRKAGVVTVLQHGIRREHGFNYNSVDLVPQRLHIDFPRFEPFVQR